MNRSVASEPCHYLYVPPKCVKDKTKETRISVADAQAIKAQFGDEPRERPDKARSADHAAGVNERMKRMEEKLDAILAEGSSVSGSSLRSIRSRKSSKKSKSKTRASVSNSTTTATTTTAVSRIESWRRAVREMEESGEQRESHGVSQASKRPDKTFTFDLLENGRQEDVILDEFDREARTLGLDKVMKRITHQPAFSPKNEGEFDDKVEMLISIVTGMGFARRLVAFVITALCVPVWLRRTGRCFECEAEGHTAAECPKKPEGKKSRCQRCGQYHLGRECHLLEGTGGAPSIQIMRSEDGKISSIRVDGTRTRVEDLKLLSETLAHEVEIRQGRAERAQGRKYGGETVKDQKPTWPQYRGRGGEHGGGSAGAGGNSRRGRTQDRDDDDEMDGVDVYTVPSDDPEALYPTRKKRKIVKSVKWVAGQCAVVAQMGGKKVPVIPDTGAQVNVITDAFLENHPEICYEAIVDDGTKTRELHGLGKSHVLGRVHIAVEMGSAVSLQKFWVVSGEDIPGARDLCLFGHPSIKDLGLVIDLRHRSCLLFGKERVRMFDVSEFPSVMLVAGQAEVTYSEDDVKKAMDSTLSELLRREYVDVFCEFPEVWRRSKIGQCRLGPFNIRLKEGDTHLPRAKPRPLSTQMRREVKIVIEELLRIGAIEVSDSSYASPIVVVGKPDGTIRLCVDFRRLNENCCELAWPLPRITDLTRMLSGCRYFAALDLKGGFWQIPLGEKSRRYCSFVTPDGQYQWRVLPFGLSQSPAVFQLAMQLALGDLVGSKCLVYLDDILVVGRSHDHLKENLRLVLSKLKSAGLYLNITKSKIAMSSVKYLGLQIDGEGIRPNTQKIQAMSGMALPESVPELRRFLGTATYFRQFIHHFADRARPLYGLLKKGAEFKLGEAEVAAFEDLRSTLCKEPVVLSYPRSAWRWRLYTDASDYGVGAALMQVDPSGREHVIECGSKSLSRSMLHWDVREKEAFAVLYFVLKYEQYLRGTPFDLFTDHSSLVQLRDAKRGKLLRWKLALAEFDFSITHIKGTSNVVADLFTRAPPIKVDYQVDERLSRGEDMMNFGPDIKQKQTIQDDMELDLPLAFPVIQRELFSLTRLRAAHASEKPKKVADWVKEDGFWRHSKSGRFYLPPSLFDEVLSYFHVGKQGYHRGTNRTSKALSRYFAIDGSMSEAVSRWIDGCLSCKARRPRLGLQGTGAHLASAPLVVVQMDLSGPVVLSDGSKVWIVSALDVFSRYPVCYLVDTYSATGPIEALKSWCQSFGSPDLLVVDQGPHFGSKFQAECTRRGIKLHQASLIRHSGTAIVESFHIYLNKSLGIGAPVEVGGRKAYDRTSLSYALSHIVDAYRHIPHPMLGETPAYLLFGLDGAHPTLRALRKSIRGASELEAHLEGVRLERLRVWDEAVARAASSIDQREDIRVKPGQLVLARLTDRERLDVGTSYFGRVRYAPSFGFPLRVKEVDAKSQQVTLQSPWPGGSCIQRHSKDLLLAPRRIDGILKLASADELMRALVSKQFPGGRYLRWSKAEEKVLKMLRTLIPVPAKEFCRPEVDDDESTRKRRRVFLVKLAG